jgi:hypothetical protein
MNATEVFQITAQIASAGAALDAAEILATTSAYRTEGVYSWALLRTSNRWSTVGPIARTTDFVFGVPMFASLMAAQLVIALLVITRLAFPFLTAAVAALFVFRIAIHVRHQIGLDGSDQMHGVVLGALFLGLLSPTAFAQDAAIWFIAFQALLAYLASGIAKLISPAWRSGAAILGIVRTHSYGKASAVRILSGNPRLSAVVCWGTIVFECAFPLIALASPRSCLVILAVGLLFHVGIAATMGLNNFVWSFLATYPSIFWASQHVAVLFSRRH